MKAITLFILLSLPVFILAQDHLYFTDGSVHTTKILEITPEVVKYKRFDFQDGPTYTIKRDDIQKIEYSNGRVEWYTEPPVEIEPPMLDDEEQEFEEEAREEEREDDLERERTGRRGKG
jgi:hypothetical protein